MAKKAPRRKFTDEEKRAIVADMEVYTATSLAEEHGISTNSLTAWKKRFGGKPAQAPEPVSRSLATAPGTTLVMIGMENPKEATIVELPRNWARALIETFKKE